MKRTGKWALSVVSRALVVILVILLLPYARNLYRLVVPGATGEIRTQSRILEQKLESSQRLEVTRIDEEGVLEAETRVIILGTVGSTTIRYRYTASVGIDLTKVVMTVDTDRIVFTLPETEILNDGIETIDIRRNDFFSKQIDKPTEVLLSEQRTKCRDQYITDSSHSQKTREDAVRAFDETICQWLDPLGERHYQIEIRFAENTAAE